MGGRGTWETTNHFQSWTEDHQRWVCEERIGEIKVIHPKGRKNGNLPEFAKTSEACISRGADGKCEHLRVYEGHYPVMEFDLGHPWEQGMKPGEIHVHHYTLDGNGMPVRSRKGDTPTDKELERWGSVLAEMKRRNK